jgi:hypothetical protein
MGESVFKDHRPLRVPTSVEWKTFAPLLALLPVLFLPSSALSQGIFQALASGDRSRIDALISEDPSILERPGPQGLNPVDMAFLQDCQRGTDLTVYVLSRGGSLDPDAVLFGRSRLLLATTFGNTEMVRSLLDMGADPEARGPDGGTVLADAVRRGHGDLVDLLLGAGANPNSVDDDGNPPLRWGVERGHRGLVDALIRSGATIDFADAEKGMTLLHFGALGGHLEIVGALLDMGAPVSSQDAHGRTPLFYAARYGQARVADLLLSRGAARAEVGFVRHHPSPYLDGRVGEGEAVIWYLAHRGLAMKTADHFLVFDAEEFGVTRPTDPGLANGFLASGEIGGEDVVVFYSAYHGYVDEPAYIHTVADSLRSVTYVHNAGDEFRGSSRALFLEPHQENQVDGVRFLTVAPMAEMSTLGYLMEVDGLRVFYQGFGAEDLEHYREELAFLEEKAPEWVQDLSVAFLPIPDAGVEAARAYLETFLEHFNPRTVALHTPPHQLAILPGGEALLRELGFTGEILFPGFPGDEFQVRGGKSFP